jgi:hypothetical protein
MMSAHGREVLQAPRFERKRILALPTAVKLPTFHLTTIFESDQPEFTCWILLLNSHLQTQGFKEGLAEPNVSKPRLVEIDTQS